MNFRVGQKICCVFDGFSTVGGLWRELSKGEVYTVRECFMYRDIPGVRLYEVINSNAPDGNERGYRAEWFRPLVDRPTSIAIFKKMLANSEYQNRREIEASEEAKRVETALFDPFNDMPWQRPFS